MIWPRWKNDFGDALNFASHKINALHHKSQQSNK